MNKSNIHITTVLPALSLFVLLIISNLTHAQFSYEIDRTTRFEKIGVNDGLSSELTTCVHQDKFGFLWIGTQNGLNLYDGYQYTVFYSNPADPEKLYSDYIFRIFEEEDGILWFCTKIGFSKYDRATQTFSNYLPDSNDISNPHNDVQKIVSDGDHLWLDVSFGLYQFNKQAETLTSFGKDNLNPEKGIKGNISNYIFMDGSGALWVGSGEEENYFLNRFDKESNTFTHFGNDPNNPESFVGKRVTSMIEDQEGNIWITTWGGGLCELLDKETGKFRNYIYNETKENAFVGKNLTTVFEDSEGNIWTGGDYGFSLVNRKTGVFKNYHFPEQRFDPRSNNIISDISEKGDVTILTRTSGFFLVDPLSMRMRHFLHDPDIKNSLSDNSVTQIIIDQAGQKWINTFNASVSKINPYANSFKHTQKTPTLKNSPSGNYITRIYADSEDNFWIGCFGGASLNKAKLNPQKVFQDFEYFGHAEGDPNTISSNDINDIFEDQDGILWFATYTGLNRYDPFTNKFTRFQHDPNDSTTISSNDVEAILEDSHGTFWVGTRNGLNIMDKEKGSFIRYLPDNADSGNILSSQFRIIYEDKQGELWFGGNYLERLNRNDTSFIHYLLDFRSSYVNVYDIQEDDSSNLWLATLQGGLIHLNTNSLKFKTFHMDQGLPSNYFVAVEIDDNGDIWAGSNRGLSRIRFDTREVRNFDIADGLLNLDIVDRSGFKDGDGWLYFGSRDGIIHFHPDSIKDNTHVPPVHITGLNIGDERKQFDQPLYELSNIELKYNENDVSFDFVALNYVNPQKNQYAFMLEGYDEDWNYVGNRRTAYYTNLNPGDYTFKVKGSNNDGYWNEEGANLMVSIHPPFWATWWAYGIYVFGFLGGLWLIRSNELKKIKLRQDLELEHVYAESLSKLDKEKNKFFSNISHEFRTPLTLILGPLSRSIDRISNEETRTDLKLVQRNARRLQTLINQLLSLTKLESGNLKLKARPENIVKLTRLLLDSFHSLAEDRGINIDFESDAEEYIVYIDKLKFEKIVNNLLSNAFKFTERGGKILVTITPPAPPERGGATGRFTPSGGLRGVQIQFSDTGIGIREERLQHVFDRFYQVDEQQKKSDLGTGIGLALTKELVELHHGEINVESKFGMGTTFTVFLRLGKDHLAEDEIFKAATTEDDLDDEMLQQGQIFVPDAVTKTVTGETVIPQESGKPLLLIVEDNADMRAYIKSYLVDDYQVMEASNGKEGAEMAIQHLPDLIVSDLMMPFVDGNEMTQQLKHDERTSHIPIILLTAKAGTESKIEGLETGADDFLTKPFDARELLVRIKNLVEQRERLRKLLSKHIGDAAQTRIIKETAGKSMSKMDEQFLEKAKNVIDEQMADPEFSVELFAEKMAMSRVQLHRKLTSLIDNSASDLIREIRLVKAAELLKKGELNVTQVTYEIGISSLSYFAKAFKEKYGVPPSEYIHK